ncbi:hypothetical protein K2173_022140 [Erythroxylum novogranatense]|uniref:DUF7780 domain-containing protein n=1 Tax=Erythroxylum novogranatense TaxID=1862640 RepID=A0AAV8STF6_9ROSI|nr:hypothetical protein K2173_022140 [Erythroxylum novogranatense]
MSVADKEAMGIAANSSKIKTTTTITTTANGRENWGMGFLLVFFPDERGSNSVSSSSSSSSSSIKRSNSNNPILTKAQSTLSICILFLFLSLILFTLSTFEPTVPNPVIVSNKHARRFLSEKGITNLKTKTKFSWFAKVLEEGEQPRRLNELLSSSALQGMGKLYLRGTRAMSDLLVGHIVDDTTEDDMRLFLRVLHRSGLTAKADTVFIYGSSSFASKFEALIQEENKSFLNLVTYHLQELNNSSRELAGPSFDLSQFLRRGNKEMADSLWGKRLRVHNDSDSGVAEDRSIQLSYGSVVGFEASELDPENSLAGFVERVPMSLRRWACYPMLLGRVRRNFKHVLLADVKNLMLFGDPLGRVRNKRAESVYVSMTKYSRRNTEKGEANFQVNSAILMGGSRGIRRLSNVMLTEIVRSSMQHKRKNPVSESGILSQLVGKGRLVKNIDLMTSTESLPEASWVVGLKPFRWGTYKMIQRGNNNSKSNEDFNVFIMRQICSSEADSFVYRDC